MKRFFPYVFGVAMVAVSCINEQNLDVTPTPGKEVKFAADMNSGAVTKTLYGADTHPNPIKVKWVDGDKVKVFGTTCAVTTADYEVAASGTNTPNSDDGLNVAETLNRIGEVGVQWGTDPTSDFVAVYPSDNASFDYDSESGVVTATTTISSIQNYVFNDEPVVKTIGGKPVSVWEGTHFANDATNPSMQNAIMYAREDGVANGDEVGLTFKPYSTVLKFRFMGFDDLWDDAGDVYVSSITLTAPSGYNIAGDFELDIPRGVSDSNPVVAYSKEGATNLTNSITINTIKKGGSYLKLTEDQAVEFNVFTVPLSGLTISKNKLWTVSIKVEGVALPYIYEMLPLEDGTYELVPGLIHKVKIPALVVDDEPIWNPGNWITQIPKPVYVSELSVPGAWYSYDLMPDGSPVKFKYQNGASLSTLYSSGVRAFHLDCRASKSEDSNDGDWAWLVGSDKPYSYGDRVYLACAGTESSFGVRGEQVLSDGIYVVNALKDIVKLAASHPDEYVVVVLTIAEKPFMNSGSAFGTIRPDVVIPLINELLGNSDVINYSIVNKDGTSTNATTTIKDAVYTNITKDTAIEDVLGRVIVKVNLNTDNFTSYGIPTLTSFGSLAAEYSDVGVTALNVEGTSYESYFAKMNDTEMYIGSKSSGLSFHYHQAQRTLTDAASNVAGIPHYKDRKKAIDDIIAKSKGVYEAGKHDAWFQIGIGGTRKNADDDDDSASRDEVADTLNTYLYDKIISKMNTDPSPVGLVLMNNCTSTAGQNLIKAIIEMNGKFYLNRRGNDVITGGGEQGEDPGQDPAVKAAAYVGPDAF